MIQQNLDEVTTAITFATWETKQEILRKYAESIVEECVQLAKSEWRGNGGGIQDGIVDAVIKVKQQIS